MGTIPIKILNHYFILRNILLCFMIQLFNIINAWQIQYYRQQGKRDFLCKIKSQSCNYMEYRWLFFFKQNKYTVYIYIYNIIQININNRKYQ